MSQVQFNLLPPSKMQSLKERTSQDVLTKQALKIAVVCLALFVLSAVYSYGLQAAQISSAKSNIKSKTKQLQQVANLNTILTVQNQLKTASSLHGQQHNSSRIFDYLAKLTPLRASVNSVALDLVTNSIKIEGSADSANTTNAFIDALKLAQYQVGSVNGTAFSGVVEDSFSINDKGVSFAINAKVDPRLFTNNILDSSGHPQTPTLSVPNASRLHNDPGSLFGGAQ